MATLSARSGRVKSLDGVTFAGAPLVTNRLIYRSQLHSERSGSPIERVRNAAARGRIEIATDAEILQTIRERLVAIEYASRQTNAELRQLRADHDRLAGRFESVTKADEIAHAVAAELDSQRRHRFTYGRKIAALVAGVILLLPALHDAILWATG